MDIKTLFQQTANFFIKLNKKQKIIIVSAVVLLIAFLVFLLVFPIGEKNFSQKNYAVLFEGMNSSDNALVLQYLQQNQIPYKVPKEDTILIPRDRVYEERIALASQGIPKSSKVGFEIFDVKDFGATDFDQQVKFIRAIEGELSRTMESLNPIERAKVHIAIPKDTVFVSREVPPTASVILKIKPNMRLLPAQVIGIKNLVAASVTKLTTENVKLVDENGEPLGEGDDFSTSRELAATQLKYKQNFEKILENKIVNILSPVVGGDDKVVARVNADFDFSQKKSTKETYDPNNVVRSEQSLEEKREGLQPKQVGGVPGVVSNIGPVQGLEDIDKKEKYEKSQNTTNYEVGKTISEIKGEFGVLSRLNAAVVVDGRYKRVQKDGVESLEYVPLSEAEMQKIDSLIRQAIGYNQIRGDDVTVSNFEFDSKTTHYIPKSEIERFSTVVTKYLGPFMPLLKYLLVAVVIFIFYKKIISPFAERMLEIQESDEEKVESLFEVGDEDEVDINKFSEMRKRIEEQLGLSGSFSEDEVKYDVLLEKIRSDIEEKPEEIATLFKTLIRDELTSEGRS